MISTLPAEPDTSSASVLATVLGERANRRGWHFNTSGNTVTGHRPEWPTQLVAIVREAEDDLPALIGLAVELGTMPLRGERFLDVFNSDREDLLRGYGNFNLRQMTGDGTWMRPVNGRSFAQGMTDGVSRKTHLALFDRYESDNLSLAERFAEDSQRFVETGAEFAALLQRLYQRTVLSVPAPGVNLPDIVRPSVAVLPIAADADSTYPWRR